MPDALRSLHVAPEEIETLQSQRLAAFAKVVAERHPHYRQRWSTEDGWADPVGQDALPVTTKDDLVADPDSFRLRTADGGFPEQWDVVYTSGSMGSPTPIHQTAADFDRILFAQRRMASIRGTRRSDRIANLFPLAPRPNGSWLRVNDHAHAIGAAVVAGMPGLDRGEYSPTRRLDDVVDVVAGANPTILWGIPSYVRRFLRACAAEGRRLSDVRAVLVSGEALIPQMASELEGLLAEVGAPGAEISPGFGASEMQCSLVPCAPGSGLHNPAPELFMLRVVDDDGVTLPSGATGHLVLSHLDRSGTVLIRYALGDIVTLDRDTCPDCGRAGERLVAHHGRSDRRVKVRGQLVDVAAIDRAVTDVPGVVEHVAEVIGAAPGGSELDHLRILVVLSDGADAVRAVSEVVSVVESAISLRPDVEVVDADQLAPDGTFKTRRMRVQG